MTSSKQPTTGISISPRHDLHTVIAAVAGDLLKDGSALGSRITLERPPRAELGDYSTNVALLLAPTLRMQPREVAEKVGGELTQRLGDRLQRVEVAGPGFVNLFLADTWYLAALEQLLAAGNAFGGGGAETPERILIEFVSANPTGPLTAAGARHGAYGDALARLLTFFGHTVGREYYFNDAGAQIQRLGESIQARAREEEVPEDGYQGAYVKELALQIDDAAKREVDELAREGTEILVAQIKASLHHFRVDFDSWFSESQLHEGSPNEIEKALVLLQKHGYLYDADGALWLRTTELGDDKDRVLRRSNGEYTYFAADIAYHLDKLERGWQRLIDVLGADHHGYVPRMKAAIAALGAGKEQFEVPIMQFVNILEGGERAAMSKRKGNFVTLDELVADIGVDATRFFMLQRSHDTTVDLDLALAREESSENPVYYIQYAHARMASILRKAGAEKVESSMKLPSGEFSLHPAERELINKLVLFPDQVAEAAQRRAPHRIAVYALELAQVFAAFYRDCRVIGAESAELEQLRLALLVATQRVVGRSLDLLGISAPESM